MGKPPPSKKTWIWMAEYGLHGVWLQRFVVVLEGAPLENRYPSLQIALRNVQEAASHTGRIWALAYDMAGMPRDRIFDELIPIRLDLGINSIYPMEVAAGMDVIALRKKFGKELIMGGGMDKRVLAGSKSAIKDMVGEKISLMREGGHVPGCDHAMPPDIP